MNIPFSDCLCDYPNPLCKCDQVVRLATKEEINMNKAQEMRNLTEAAKAEAMRQKKEAVGEYYKKVLKTIQDEASQGYSGCEINIPKSVCIQTLKDCLLDDGFELAEDAFINLIIIRW